MSIVPPVKDGIPLAPRLARFGVDRLIADVVREARLHPRPVKFSNGHGCSLPEKHIPVKV